MSTPKYDAEDLLDTVLSVMTTGSPTSALDAKIAAIDAEKTAKGKGLLTALAPIGTNYYLQSWTDKVLNSTPAIFYGIEDVAAKASGAAVAKTYLIFVEVVLVDDGNFNDSSKRINRYVRALEELFTVAFAPAMGHGAVEITQMRPMAFKLNLDSDDEVKVGGVSLSVSLF